MNTMCDLYNTLRNTPYFIDNEFLEKYCLLVERHRHTKVKPRLTNSHHIIPKSWFKLNGLTVDNSLTNLVNLPYREHILSHYYLCLCTTDELLYANELGLMCLLNRKKLNPTDKYLIQHLSMYNNIYEDYLYKRKTNYKLYK